MAKREWVQLNEEMAGKLTGYNVHIYTKGKNAIMEIPHLTKTGARICVDGLLELTPNQ